MMTSTHKCPVCIRAVAERHRAIICDGCSRWCHIKCGNVNPKTYEELLQVDNFSWYCPKCSINEILENSETQSSCIYKDLVKDIQLSKRKGLTIAHLNTNGLLDKLYEIQILLYETNFDILAVTETHLTNDISDFEINVTGYSLVRKDREQGNCGWGGTLLYYRTNLQAFENKTFESFGLEVVLLEVLVKSQKIVVASLYHPPRDYQSFLASFDKFLQPLWLKRNNIIILGDLNIDLSIENKRNCSIERRFKNIRTKYDLKNVINKPTRITNHSQTLIDHIITSRCRKTYFPNSVDIGLSDHNLIYCFVDLLPNRSEQKFLTVKDYQSVNTIKLKSDIQNAPWQICSVFDDVDDVTWAWETIYKDIINDHIKTRQA